MHDIVPRMSGAVFRILRRLTAFPTADDLETVGAGFKVLRDGSPTFHEVAGKIYGCHIRSEPPANELSTAFVPDVAPQPRLSSEQGHC